MNRKLAPNIETMFMMTGSDSFYLSSRLVREVASLGGDVRGMVPDNVNEALKNQIFERIESIMSNLKLHPRVSQLKPSATLGVKQKAKVLRDQGHDVVDLSAGEPDFGTPQCIIDAAKKALDEGATRYTPVKGMDALIKACQTKLERDQGVRYEPSEIIHSVGESSDCYGFRMFGG